tara:strand:- start:153 stop:398 length:246 start_codon:yes stop_codon:yes gene_type:complete
MYRTLALAAALAPVTGFAPALRATARSVALKAKYTDANGNPIKAALSASLCGNQPVLAPSKQRRRIDGVEDDATNERAVNI